MTDTQLTEIAWLVECPKYHPGEYFALCECGCGRHYWTKDVHAATKFASKGEAETARGGDVNCIAIEHEFGLKIPRPTPNSMTQVVEALTDAEDALRNYACHGGAGVPCQRSAHQCQAECGKPAGDALLKVLAAIKAVLEDKKSQG